MKLWFGNSFGKRRVIADCATPAEVTKAINDFVDECNAKKPKGQTPFKIYYTRVWQTDDGLVKYDVGSHSEFFYWEGPIGAYMENKE